MNRKILSAILAVAMISTLSLSACGNTTQVQEQKPSAKATDDSAKTEEKSNAEVAVPGESGFNEIKIGEDIVGPFEVGAVYFQAVDMIPAGHNLSAAESDMHLEADIHLTPEAAKAYGFGDGDSIWPAYLNVTYKVMSEDGSKEITSGVFMPMNADDGPHYGMNIKKGLIPVGKYKLILEIQATQDYMLHVDEETGVPAAKESVQKAEEYFKKQVVTFDWNYDASQLKVK